MKILVTGSSGYVARHLISKLRAAGHNVCSTSHRSCVEGTYFIGAINGSADWSESLRDVDCVIHAAGMTQLSVDLCEEDFNRVNVDGTKRLVQQSIEAGISSFILISSASVYGQGSEKAFTEDDPCHPITEYASSKLKSEYALLQGVEHTNIKPLIIRCPMIYGVGNYNSFNRLVSIVKKGVPLPFLGINNRRSLLSIDRLCDALVELIDNRSAYDYHLLNLSENAISTAEMIKAISLGLNKESNLFKLPTFLVGALLLLTVGKLTRNKLIGNHVIDTSRAKKLKILSDDTYTLTSIVNIARNLR